MKITKHTDLCVNATPIDNMMRELKCMSLKESMYISKEISDIINVFLRNVRVQLTGYGLELVKPLLIVPVGVGGGAGGLGWFGREMLSTVEVQIFRHFEEKKKKKKHQILPKNKVQHFPHFCSNIGVETIQISAPSVIILPDCGSHARITYRWRLHR